jgi:hypothetical protein
MWLAAAWFCTVVLLLLLLLLLLLCSTGGCHGLPPALRMLHTAIYALAAPQCSSCARCSAWNKRC